MDSFLEALPTIVGALIGLFGTLLGGWLNAWLGDRDKRELQRLARLEEIASLCYEIDSWRVSIYNSSAAMNGEVPRGPFERIHLLSTLYFPNLEPLAKKLATTSSAYAVWTIEFHFAAEAGRKPTIEHF
jgi:hypothetical protein